MTDTWLGGVWAVFTILTSAAAYVLGFWRGHASALDAWNEALEDFDRRRLENDARMIQRYSESPNSVNQSNGFFPFAGGEGGDETATSPGEAEKRAE